MSRKGFCFMLLAMLILSAVVSNLPAADQPLISDTTANRHGLQRAWFVQADIDRGRSRLQDMKLYDGTLYMISDSAMVEAVDAETGAKIWSKRIGSPDHPCMPLGVGGDLLAVVNGSRLYVANRYNGTIIYEHMVDGAPGGGPGVNSRRVYVPTTTGMIMAYSIDLLLDMSKDLQEKKDQMKPDELKDFEKVRQQKIHANLTPAHPLFFRSKGRTLVQPLMLRQSNDEEYAAWPTDEGHLYIGHINRRSSRSLDIASHIKANAPITMQPGYLPPTPNLNPDAGVIFFGSNDGFVTAITEDGNVLWQFPTGEAIVQPPVSIGDRVYFSTKRGGMYCVDAMPDSAKRAVKHWYAPGALQFLAVNTKHVYAADASGNTLILDAQTGERVDSLPAAELSLKLVNSQTDRLYLASPTGLVQCFHEIGVDQPLRYDLERKKAEEAAKPVAEKKSPGKAGSEAASKAASKETVAPKKSAAKKGKAAEDEKAAEEEKPAEEKPAEEKPAEEKPAESGGANPFDK